MAHEDYAVDLPDIFPLDEIIVRGEQHIYKVFEGDGGHPLPEEEYTLDKAPIVEILEVTGTVNESEFTFEQGTDYELSADSERILWLDGDRPDPGTAFYVTYRTESIISRYVESGDEQLENIEQSLTDAINTKFLESAEGEELDQIGALFGPVIGKRRDRDDEQYRIYLESVVQSFVSRGTIDGIKLAISAATDVPIEDITIDEDFERNEYEVIVIPNTAVDVALLEEIAEIADPSGVLQIRTRFPVFDQMAVDDSVNLSEGIGVDDQMGVSDDTGIFRRDFFDTVVIDDAVDIPPKDAITTDTMFADDAVNLPPAITTTDSSLSDDTVLIDPNLTTTTDTTGIADEGVPRRTEVNEDIDVTDIIATPRGATTDVTGIDDGRDVLPRDINTARWEEQDQDHTTEWDFFEWTEIVDLVTASSETLGITDTATEQAKAAVTSDTLFADDANAIDANLTTTTDTAFANDAVEVIFNETQIDEDIGTADAAFIDPNTTSTSDTGGSNDTVTQVSTTFVGWNAGDWESMEWAIEHN